MVIPGDVSLYALDTRGYEALSRNLAEVARWMKEASWQLEFYRSSRTVPQEVRP